jgi:hypothetical protein
MAGTTPSRGARVSGGAIILDVLQQRALARDTRERGQRIRVCFACERPTDRVLGWQASSVVPCGRCGRIPSDGTMIEEPGPASGAVLVDDGLEPEAEIQP